MSGTELRLRCLADKCRDQEQVVVKGSALAILYLDLQKAISCIDAVEDFENSIAFQRKKINELTLDFIDEVKFSE